MKKPLCRKQRGFSLDIARLGQGHALRTRDLEFIPESFMHQVGKFTGVKKQAVTQRAAFIDHVRLIMI